jgi:hypothetical protein
VAPIRVDETRAPLILVTYPDQPTPDDMRELFAQYADLSRRHEKVAYLIDFRAFNPISAPASHRKVAADLFAEYRAVLQASTVCEARVVESGFARGVLTAFDWLTGAKWPCANFGTMQRAEAWIESHLREANLPSPV